MDKTIQVGSGELTFHVGNAAVNKYLNTVSEKDKITPSVNFLLANVVEADKDALKQLILDTDNTPRGGVVLQMTGLLIADAVGDVDITLKK